MSHRPPPEPEPPPLLVRFVVSMLISLGALLLAGGAYLVTANEIVAAVIFAVGWVVLQAYFRDALANLFHPSGSGQPPRRRR